MIVALPGYIHLYFSLACGLCTCINWLHSFLNLSFLSIFLSLSLMPFHCFNLFKRIDITDKSILSYNRLYILTEQIENEDRLLHKKQCSTLLTTVH